MRKISRSVSSWFLLVLFISFIGGITLFTHTHVINQELYYHSHPYDKSENKQHTHTDGQLQLLDLYYNTTLEPDILPNIGLNAFQKLEAILYSRPNISFESTNKPNHFRLRAPPLA